MRLGRLTLLATLILALLVAPLAVESQPARKPVRLGLLYGASPSFGPESDPYDKAFVEGLRENGYVVGQNVGIEFRTALANPDRLPRLAADPVTPR